MSVDIGSNQGVKDGRHPMGVHLLDSELIRGIPKGSTVAILGNPTSESEMILHSLPTTGRKTKYVSLLRNDNIIEDIIRINANSSGNVENEKVKENTDVIKKDISESIPKLEDMAKETKNGNLIIDGFSLYSDFIGSIEQIRKIQKIINENNGLCYIYLSNNESNLTKFEKEILQLVDGVFDVKTEAVHGNRIENNLVISKMRGMDAPEEPVKLGFENSIQVDTTEDIGGI